MRSHPLALAFLLSATLLTLARPARAQIWFDASQSRLEDRFADGDLDVEDLARTPALARRGSAGRDVLAQTWVSLVGFSRQLPSGLTDVGGFVVVGLALDKIVEGATHPKSGSLAEGPPSEPRRQQQADPQQAPHAAAPAPAPSSLDPPRLAIDAALARGAVRTAWRLSGIEVNDARIDAMIARSRLSAILPETRVRVMQVFQDGEHTSSYVDEAGTVVDTAGTTTTVEARFTWRFDRLLFADDEPTLERVRLQREEARSRIGAKVLDLLFGWQRALLDEAGSDAGSRAELEATLRRIQAEIALDVMTGGWFGAQPAVRRRPASVAPAAGQVAR